MWVKKLKIINFRNYDNAEVDFCKGINIFYGENAQGKTNILEAIYLCAMGKSFRAKKDRELINIEADNALVVAEFEKEDRDGKVKVVLDNKKTVFLNGIKLKKLSELISNLHIVIFTPDDINILKGAPDNYLTTLKQRNLYLKQIKDEDKNPDLLEVWDEKLVEYANSIYLYRKEFIDKLNSEIKGVHKEITNNKEEILINYLSECGDKDVYTNLLKERRKLDIIKGFTTKGIHRDDFEIFINDKLVNVYGSQGQHRTSILSLKLAELAVVKSEIGESPILLLDDFMSELDKARVHNFLEKIGDIQVIITCTDKLDIEKKDFFVYNVRDGKIFKDDL